MMVAHSDSQSPRLTASTLGKLSTFIRAESGIEFDASKRAMVEARLLKRMRVLELDSFEAYCAILASPQHREERAIATDLLTTHTTNFFREKHHFDFLTSNIIRPFCSLWSKRRRELRVWSAGCSTGEEPYTISMVLRQHMGENPYQVLATDVAQPTLERARQARYAAADAQGIPPLYRTAYRLKGNERELDHEITRAVLFRPHNLMSTTYPSSPRHHVIFIRNVLIYFSYDNQKDILTKLLRCLVPRGFLFIGHSESATGLGLPLELVGPTVYRKVEA